MAYDEGLAERIREGLAEERDVTEKKMFGGVAFMLRGSMFVGIVKEDLMVRVGAEAHDDALREPHARTMDFTGKPMRGYVYVAPQGYARDDALRGWLARGLAFVRTLPAKGDTKRAPAKAAKTATAERGKTAKTATPKKAAAPKKAARAKPPAT